jgi:hypothetical protein
MILLLDELCRNFRFGCPADSLTPSRLAVFVSSGDLGLWLGGDGNLNVSTLFELHILAMFVS